MEIDKVIQDLTLEEKAGLCSGADFWHTKAVERLGIPEVMMCDGPHGLRKQTGKTDMLGLYGSERAVCFPSASALAASFDTEVLERLGECLGRECQAQGIAMLLGPGVNIKRSPLCGRNFEYFSEDPYLTGVLASAYVKSIQKQGVAACVKHFACNNQEKRRMCGDSRVEDRTLHEIYLAAFEKVVRDAGVRSIMCAYNALNGTFCAENKTLLTGILREKWGYDGMVVTDWGAVKNRVKGLEAGLDLEMPGGPGAQDKMIVEAVQSGVVSENTLDCAVKHILRFLSKCMEEKRKAPQIDWNAEHKASVEIEEECAVLLKNDDAVLPIRQDAEIAFIGAFAQAPRYQGSGSSRVNAFEPVGAVEAAKKRGYAIVYAEGYSVEADDAEKDEQLLKEALEVAETVKTAVVFAGLPSAYECEGADRETLDMPVNQNRLIQELARVQKNIVVVLHAGAPVIMPWRSKVKAILNMYLGGEGVGEAAVALLYGEVNPSGKLAETYPLKLSDNPSYLNFPGEEGTVTYRESIFVGYRYYDKKEMEVAYPFGYGLSYTVFSYRNIMLSAKRMTDKEQVTVSCRIKNIGNYKGKEAVQLYVGKKKSTVLRPVRELKGVQKIELLPDEEKEVRFVLDKRAFAYYSTEISDWYAEEGEYCIEIGASSREIHVKDTIWVEPTQKVPVHINLYSACGELMKYKEGKEFLYKLLRQRYAGMEGTEQQKEEFIGRMIETRMADMPISSLMTYGLVTEAVLEEVLHACGESAIGDREATIDKN